MKPVTEHRVTSGGSAGRASRTPRLDPSLRRLVERGARLPPVRLAARWYARRPFLTSWGALAAGMVAVVVLFGRDAGLSFRQHATLAAVTVALAWLCTWIIFLEDGTPDERG